MNLFKAIRRIMTTATTIATTPECLFRQYDIDIEFVNGIAGGTPLNPDLMKQHIRLFSEGVSNPLKYAMKVEGAVTEEAMEEHLKRASSGFPADEKGIFIRGFQINAML